MSLKIRASRLIAIAAIAAGAAQAKDYHAERFDVRVNIQRDGSALVAETVVFAFSGGPFTYVYRDLSARETDGIVDIRASMDGREMPVEIRRSNRVRVTWRFEPVSDSAHSFELSYRALGAVRKSEGGDTLSWRAIPENLKYSIGASTVEIEYPPDASLAFAPEIRGAEANIQTQGNLIRFETGRIRREHSVDVAATFTPGALIAAPPRWQAASDERGRQIGEAAPTGFVAFAVVLFAGFVILLRLRDTSEQGRLRPHPLVIHEPPSDLRPAMAGRLAGYGAGQPMLALAALFDLARRGILRIEEDERKRWGSRNFWIVKTDVAAATAPHEQALLRIVFPPEKEPLARVKMSDFASRLSWKSGQFHGALKSEMQAAGLIDPERRAKRNRRSRNALLTLLLGIALAVPALFWGASLTRAARWEALPVAAGLIGAGAGLFFCGLVHLIAAGIYSPLSFQGAIASAEWKGFAARLKRIAKGRETVAEPDLDRYLPYAAAFGLGAAWAKQFKVANAAIPAWFQACADGGDITAFVAVMSSGSGGHGVGGAGGGGGASGGGGGGAG